VKADLRPSSRDVLAAFLVAAALIVFQISFTRLVSYKLFYHFVFLAISLSLLGLGAAGTFVAVRGTRRRDPAYADGATTGAMPAVNDAAGAEAAASEAAGGIAAARIHLWLAVLVPSVPLAFLAFANPFGIAHHPPIRTKLLGTDAIAYLAWCAPIMVWLNFCGGVVLTTLFSRYSERMGRLYAADLAGAAAGALACVALMKFLSPPAAFVAGVIPLAVAAVAAGESAGVPARSRLVARVVTAGALALSAWIFVGPEWLRNFQNFRVEGGALRKILKYEWNHIIRTDHTAGWYVLDGEAATRIVKWEAPAGLVPPRTPAYHLAPASPSVAVIGVGGGRELSEALRAGASSVLAIDINPTILEWARGEDRKLNGGLYFDPRVDVQLGEGRHVIRSAGTTFDLIVIHAIDTYAAAAAGAYALTENFLYTREAFADYFRALSRGGALSVSRWMFYPPREDLRVFATARAALEDLGVENPNDHLVMVAPLEDATRLGDRRVWGYFTMTKRPLTREDVARLQIQLRKQKWSILYAPHMDTGTPFDQLAKSKDAGAFEREYPYLVSPVSDASPYLFQFYDPLNPNSWTRSRDWATSDIYQSSAVMLLVALAGCTLASIAIILAPLAWARRRASATSGGTLSLREVAYFAGLGLGYMALEVPVVQVLSMYLGHPVYGLTVALVALLLASGLGSLLVERFDPAPAVPCAIVTALLVAVTLGVFPLLHATLDLSDPARFSLALALVFVCGVPMGMPLALGVRRLGRRGDAAVAWAWGTNGAASVVGSCLVMISMVFAGAHAALAIGVASYAMAAATAPRD
jgi:spermidine synthase